LALGEQRFSKAADRAGVRAQIAALRGKTHALHSAVAVVHGGTVVFEHVDAAHLTMWNFSDAFLDGYLDTVGAAATTSVAATSSKAWGCNCSSASRAIISPCSACRCCRCSTGCDGAGHLAK